VAVLAAITQKYTNMAKAVKWQIPFSTADVQNPTYYRIDIYADDDGSWDHNDPTQLTAGEQPFVTDEDNDEDLFAPIRTQTGSIQVCTLKPDGTMLTLDEILPVNNIDHPVRLLNITDANNPVIEWQGFLSCEAYSQKYTSIPENLTLSIISVLEAMDSVQLDQSRSSGLTSIVQATFNVLNEIVVQSCMTFYSHVNYSMTTWRIFNKFIDQTIFFEQKEYDNENSTTYIVSGLSAKEALERLCKFMGWIAREQGTELYLAYIGENIGMYKEEYHWFDAHYLRPDQDQTPSIPITIGEIANLVWRGIDHQRDIRQGAKSVEVVAKIKTNDFGIRLPDFPFGDTTSLGYVVIKYKSNTFKYFYDIINNNNDAYSNITYGYYSGTITRTGDSAYTAEFLGASTKEDFFSRMSLYPHSPTPYISKNPMVSGAAFIRYAIEDQVTDTHDMQTGLYCPLLPGCSGNYAPIFKIWTPKYATFLNGKIILSSDMLFNALYRYNGLNQQIMSDQIGDGYVDCDGEKLDMVLRVGDMYWDGTDWVETFAIFQATMTGSGIDIEIPVDRYLSGQVQLEVLAGVTVGGHVNTLYEVIFKSIDLSFKYNEDYQASDRSENHYFRLLGTNFRDEISISNELASDLNNQPSPSILMNNDEEKMTTVDYTVSGGIESRRPEVDLLNRLASYYGASRQKLDLIVMHPATPLPLLKLNGINDGKVYLPLSESRDWRQEVSTLTCFEVPEEQPSES